MDSSSENLLRQLNNRARMWNPAIALYILSGLLGTGGLLSSGDSQQENAAAILLIVAVGALIIGFVVHKKNGASGYLVAAGARSRPPQWK